MQIHARNDFPVEGWLDLLPFGWIQTLVRFVHSLESRWPGYEGHSGRVALLATRLGLAAGMDKAEISALGLGVFLHDIGKVAVPDAILNKPGRLSAGEYQLVQLHPAVGEAILSPLLRESDPRILDAVLYHHERFDGAGYPHGLRGKEIPLWGRICCIADAWDAMTMSRPYRSAFGPAQAAEELQRCAGSHFDPDLVPLFLMLVNP